MNNEAGKGDSYRPVNYSLYCENYERIFKDTNTDGGVFAGTAEETIKDKYGI